MSPAQSLVLPGFSAVLLRLLLERHTPMQSYLEILLVNVKTGTSKKTGNAYSIPEAHCVLRNDDGSAGAVGVLNVPKALEETAKPGLYRASFALEASTFGDNAGKIVATLSGLTPVNAAQAFKSSATRAAAAAAGS